MGKGKSIATAPCTLHNIILMFQKIYGKSIFAKKNSIFQKILWFFMDFPIKIEALSCKFQGRSIKNANYQGAKIRVLVYIHFLAILYQIKSIVSYVTINNLLEVYNTLGVYLSLSLCKFSKLIFSIN